MIIYFLFDIILFTICKFCGAEKCIKNGFTKLQKQRFLCKSCEKSFCENKGKYSAEFKRECLHFYLSNTGIRAISEVKKIPHSLLIYWIKKSANIAKEKLQAALIKSTEKDIEIIEIDELVTYIKKTFSFKTRIGNLRLYLACCR